MTIRNQCWLHWISSEINFYYKNKFNIENLNICQNQCDMNEFKHINAEQK